MSAAEDGPRGRADVIVVAAGRSTRMVGSDKLAVEIAGLPLLGHAVRALAAAGSVGRVVIVTSPERAPALRDASWLPSSVVAVVEGGARRQESVAAGLATLDRLDAPRVAVVEDRPVLVHDGARPLVRTELVERVVDAVVEHGAAIPVVPVRETVKRVVGGRVAATVDRTELATAQTPQGARRGLLRAAFARYPADGATEFTDEAALLEACTIAVHAIPGDPANVKVTVPDDLEHVARAFAGPGTRIGFGHDSHPFGPGGPLALGGITVDGAPRLHGHSDGDVALHAIADALLGAAGLGDLGRLFPADARTPRGIASTELLAVVVGRLAEHGLRPAGVDLVILGARPRLGERLDAMRGAIAAVLGLSAAQVNVKASTGNLAGMEGAGRGVSARAVATVVVR